MIRKLEWEEFFMSVNGNICTHTHRIKVKGGWLVNNVTQVKNDNGTTSLSESMVFVSDPFYKWKVR